MPKEKQLHADLSARASKSGLDLSVVLSLAGIISVTAAIGAAALSNGVMVSSDEIEIKAKPDLAMKIARLDKKLAEMSAQMENISTTQNSTSARVGIIEEAFIPTASISTSTSVSATSKSSPYFRISEAGWNADDTVTRTQKRDRTARLKMEAGSADTDFTQIDSALEPVRYAVRLDSYKNILTARKAWDKLNEVHGNLFNKLEPNLLPVLNAQDNEGRVKLVVGPIKTANRAARVCSVLRSNGQVCQERLFSSSNIMVVSAPGKRMRKSAER